MSKRATIKMVIDVPDHFDKGDAVSMVKYHFPKEIIGLNPNITCTQIDEITSTPEPKKSIFVFGSNLAGVHGAGAALAAYRLHAARMGDELGRTGNAWAIPTKDASVKNSLSLAQVQGYVDLFIEYAKAHPELEFQVTRIGCGLAGFKDIEIATMFINAPDNCLFDYQWREYLPYKRFWGTY